MGEYTYLVAKELYRLYQAKPDNNVVKSTKVIDESEILNLESLKSLTDTKIKDCLSELVDLGYLKRYIRSYRINDEFFSFADNL